MLTGLLALYNRISAHILYKYQRSIDTAKFTKIGLELHTKTLPCNTVRWNSPKVLALIADKRPIRTVALKASSRKASRASPASSLPEFRTLYDILFLPITPISLNEQVNPIVRHSTADRNGSCNLSAPLLPQICPCSKPGDPPGCVLICKSWKGNEQSVHPFISNLH